MESIYQRQVQPKRAQHPTDAPHPSSLCIYLLAQVLQGNAGVGGVDLAEARLDDVVRQPLDERVRLVRPEDSLMLQPSHQSKATRPDTVVQHSEHSATGLSKAVQKERGPKARRHTHGRRKKQKLACHTQQQCRTRQREKPPRTRSTRNRTTAEEDGDEKHQQKCQT